MTLLTKILTPFREVKKWLFGKPEEVAPKDWTWVSDEFYASSRRKWHKIDSLRHWIEVTETLADRRQSQRKAHLPIRAQIKRVEQEIRDIENGRMVYDPAFGAWVVKVEK